VNLFDLQARLRELERRLGELERRLGDQERRAVNDAQRFALLRLWMMVTLIVWVGMSETTTRIGLAPSDARGTTAFVIPGLAPPSDNPRLEAKPHWKTKGCDGSASVLRLKAIAFPNGEDGT